MVKGCGLVEVSKTQNRINNMRTCCVTTILICFMTMTGFLGLFAPAAEVQHVHFGSNVTLGCNVSYLYGTTWLKQNPDLTPTVVLCASLRAGRPAEGFQLSPRHSASLMNRSLALRIAGVEKGDLGLYFCIANVNTRVIVGRATRLYGPRGSRCPPTEILLGEARCPTNSPLQNSSWFEFRHWYVGAVGSGLLIMVLTVGVTHWRTKPRK